MKIYSINTKLNNYRAFQHFEDLLSKMVESDPSIDIPEDLDDRRYEQLLLQKAKEIAGNCDPTTTKKYSKYSKYIKWILSEIEKGSLVYPEDCSEVKNSLEKFESFLNSGSTTEEINRLSVSDLHRLVSELEGGSQHLKLDVNVLEQLSGWELKDSIFKNGSRYDLFYVNNPEAWSILSQGTVWCTKEVPTADGFLNDGPAYMVYKNGKPYLNIHEGSKQFKGVHNDAVSIGMMTETYELLAPLNFQEDSGEFEYYALFEELKDLSFEEAYNQLKDRYKDGRLHEILYGLYPKHGNFIIDDLIRVDDGIDFSVRFIDNVEYIRPNHVLKIIEGIIDRDQTGEWCSKFALNIKGLTGEQIDILLEAVIDRDLTGQWCFKFAYRVPNLTKEQIDILFKAVIDRDQTGEWCYKFAYWVQGLTNQQKEVLLEAAEERGYGA